MGTRAMMRAELQKLRAPLGMLNSLSRCLADEPEDIEIRQSLAALVCRTECLKAQLNEVPETLSSSARLDASDTVRGTT